MTVTFRRLVSTRLAPAGSILLAVLLAACASGELRAPPLSPGSISRSDREVAEAAYQAGLDAVEAGNDEEALRQFTRVVEEYPASDVSGLALYWQGRTQYQVGRAADAAASLERYLALAPELPFRESAVLLLANSRYEERDFTGSLAAGMRVHRVSAQRAGDYVDLARDLLKQLPRAQVEAAVRQQPPRDWLAPFYLQAARWAYAAGDSARARALATTVTGFPELPAPVLADARTLAGPESGRMTRPRLGFIAPTEGRFAEVSEQIRRGVELALDDLNRDRATKVELVDRPTASDPDSTAQEIRSLARNERVEAILGPLISENALPAARIAEEEGVPLVSPTATDARLLQIGRDVFTVNALDGAIGHTIGTYAVRSLDRKRFAILAVDNAYGRIQAEAFASGVEAAGGRVVIRRDYAPGSSQFTDYLGQIVRAGADAVFLATNRTNEALRILNQLAFYELGGILPLGTDAWNDPSFYEQGRGFVRGYFADTFSHDPRVTRWNDFAAEYRSRYGEDPPNLFPAWGYDAARLALEYLSPAAPQTTASTTYRGASGLFRFTTGGKIRRAVVIHRIEQGRPVALEW